MQCRNKSICFSNNSQHKWSQHKWSQKTQIGRLNQKTKLNCMLYTKTHLIQKDNRDWKSKDKDNVPCNRSLKTSKSSYLICRQRGLQAKTDQMRQKGHDILFKATIQ